MAPQTRRISPGSGLNVDPAMSYARPERPAWSGTPPQARNSTSSLWPEIFHAPSEFSRPAALAPVSSPVVLCGSRRARSASRSKPRRVTQARASANGPVGWVDESAPTRRDFAFRNDTRSAAGDAAVSLVVVPGAHATRSVQLTSLDRTCRRNVTQMQPRYRHSTIPCPEWPAKPQPNLPKTATGPVPPMDGARWWLPQDSGRAGVAVFPSAESIRLQRMDAHGANRRRSRDRKTVGR